MDNVVLDALTDLYGSDEFHCSRWFTDLYWRLKTEGRSRCTGGEIHNAFQRLRLTGVIEKVRGDRRDVVWRLAKDS